MLTEEENSNKQKENRQENLMAELALSAKEQINKHMEKILEPHLDVLLAKKVKLNALQRKGSKRTAKKDKNYKL